MKRQADLVSQLRPDRAWLHHGVTMSTLVTPPGPDAPRLVDVEDDQGRSIRYGEWLPRGYGSWVLRILTG